MEYRIRQLNKADIPDAIQLFQASFQNDHMYNEYGLSVIQESDIFSNAITYAINHGLSFGVFSDNQLISFLLGFDYHNGFLHHKTQMSSIFGLDKDGQSLYAELTDFFKEAEKHKNLYYIMSIATLQQYRKQGLASSLIDTLIQSTAYDIIGDVSSMISMPMYQKRKFQITPLGTDYNMVVLTR